MINFFQTANARIQMLEVCSYVKILKIHARKNGKGVNVRKLTGARRIARNIVESAKTDQSVLFVCLNSVHFYNFYLFIFNCLPYTML